MSENADTLKVAILAFDGAMASQIAGCVDLLSDAFEVQIAGPRRGVLNCANGQQILPAVTLESLEPSDIVIIPSMDVSKFEMIEPEHPIVLWLKSHWRSCGQVCALSGGAFLLGAAGLLTNRRATTHWALSAEARTHLPRTQFDLDAAFVAADKDARILTSGGGTCWQDLCIHLITQHCGSATAGRVARMNTLLGTAVGQLPFADWAPEHDHGDEAILAAQHWMDENITMTGFLEHAIALSGLTERTFKRRFPAATGFSPTVYMQHARMQDARYRLEATREPVEEIAAAVGYSDLSFFRKLFRQRVGMTPGEYRARFGFAG